MILKHVAWSKRLPWFILIAICIVFFALANRKMDDALPYPTHIDEHQRLEAAKHMLQTGDLNPHYFHKPTFHIYLTAAGLIAGFLKEASQGRIRTVAEIGSMSYPYYTHPIMVKTAKQLFILLASLALLLTAYTAYQTYRHKVLLILPALLLPFSDMFIYKTVASINVNILGAFCLAALLSYIFYNLHRPGTIAKSILPGILCGLVVSSKYNFLAAYLPCFLAIFFYEQSRWLSRSILLLCVSILTVVLINPYFVLDLPSFLDQTAYQVRHYLHRGHPGFQGEPGVSQFNYYLHALIGEFGLSAFLFSGLGLVYMFQQDWKKTLIFISFPVGMLLLMSASKVNFLRNLTPVYMLWPVLISMGLIFFYQWIRPVIEKKQFHPRIATPIAISLTALLLLPTLPWPVLAGFMASEPDSRNQATHWIQHNIPEHSTLVIARDLNMDPRPLIKHYKIRYISQKKLRLDYIVKRYFKPDTYFLIPDYGLDSRYKGQKKLAYMDKQISALFNTGKLEPVRTFGSNKVLLNYTISTADGDPKIYLAKYLE